MAGQPKLLKLDQDITARGGEDWLIEQFREGRTIEAVARELGVSRFLLDRWVFKRSASQKQEIASARAGRMVEEALELVDSAESPADASIKRERARLRTWIAERMDRQAWGQQGPAGNVTLNVNTLHLTALQQLNNGKTPVEVREAGYRGEIARACGPDADQDGGDGVATGDGIVVDENDNITDQGGDVSQA